MPVRGEQGNNLYGNFGDPYYLEYGYGLGYTPQGGMCGPTGGYEPGMGYGPNMGYGPGMGYGPPHGEYGCYYPGYPAGPGMAGGLEELTQICRETNRCCREILEMMRRMHEQGHMMQE